MFGLSTLFNAFLDADTGFEMGELFTIGFAPLAVASLIFWAGVKLQHAGKPKWLKWLGVLPLVVGLILGITPFRLYFFDPIYSSLNPPGKKMAIMHASGIVLPFIGAIGLWLWQRWLNRQKFDEL